MKPLAVTFSHNWVYKNRQTEFENMTERLSVDLIEFTPNRELVNKLAKKPISKLEMLVGTVTLVLMLFHFKPPSNLISHL